MWIKSSAICLILALNSFEKYHAKTKTLANVDSVLKKPLKIVASDDEVLQPLHEKEEGDSNTGKPIISQQNPTRRSRKSGGKNRRSHPIDEFSFLKMNLDLPSINSNIVSAGAAPKAQLIFSSSSSSSSNNAPLFEKKALIKKEINHVISENFDSPFGNEKIKDIDIVLFRPSVSNSVAPGTVIATSSSYQGPKTFNDKQNIPLVPAVSTGFDVPMIESTNQSLQITVPQIIGLTENFLPCNSEVVNNKKPSILPPKMKKVRSLDEYSIEGLTFDHANPGPKIGLDTNITTSFINSILIPFFKSGKVLDRKSSYSILYRAYQEFLEEESLHDIQLESDEKIIIFGDIHGQFPDFIKVMEKEGPPSDKLKYLFNGDIVDRGAYSIECLMTLLAYKIAEPDNFFISLGNHETASVGKLQFHKESIKKYGNDEFFKLSHALFKSFPAAYLIQNEVFVTHGGISPFITLDRIREIDRIEPDIEDEDIINDLIWSDPVNTNGTTTSHRGLGFLFGPDITREFVQQNNISVVIRSHQYKEFGFSEQHNDLCITIFSCPNYRGKMKNYGAYIKLDDQLNLTYNIFRAAEPNAKTEYPSIPSNLKYNRNVRRNR